MSDVSFCREETQNIPMPYLVRTAVCRVAAASAKLTLYLAELTTTAVQQQYQERSRDGMHAFCFPWQVCADDTHIAVADG